MSNEKNSENSQVKQKGNKETEQQIQELTDNDVKHLTGGVAGMKKVVISKTEPTKLVTPDSFCAPSL